MDEHLASTSYRTDDEKIQALTQILCANLGLPNHEVSVSFVTREEIQDLNREHRDIDRPTDVLSFPQEEFAEPVPVASSPAVSGKLDPEAPPQTLGDIIICLEVAEKNAKAIGQDLDREVAFLLVHGMLHLVGYDHEEPAEEAVMLAAQKQLMARITPADAPPIWQSCALEVQV